MKLVYKTPTQNFFICLLLAIQEYTRPLLKNVLIMKLYKFSHNSYPEGEEKVLCNEFVVTTSVVCLVIDHN